MFRTTNDLLMQDDEKIQPNSQYDQSIAFDEDSEPGAYSPRPNPEESYGFSSLGNAPNNQLNSFQLNFGDEKPQRSNFGFSGLADAKFDITGGFNPANAAGLQSYSPRSNNDDFGFRVPAELSDLWAKMSEFQPPDLEIAPHFKPFLPELNPSIGAIDAFIKVPRPDGEQDVLGLTVLDEPTIGCSNPQILKMQLREKFGITGGAKESDGYIGSIRNPFQNIKELQSFIDSYDEISRNRAAPNMTYSFKVPDIEELMEPWADEMETALASLPLPGADLDLTLEEYARVICALLDIPVKGNLVESVHLLFTLYQQFKECNYFKNP